MISQTSAKVSAVPGHAIEPRQGPMYLSPASFFADFYVYPILAASLVALALYRMPQRWFAVGLTVVIGFASWTFIEYIMHRYVLHHLTYIKDQHAKHHDDQKALFGTPTWLSLVVFLMLVTGPAVTWVGL